MIFPTVLATAEWRPAFPQVGRFGFLSWAEQKEHWIEEFWPGIRQRVPSQAQGSRVSNSILEHRSESLAVSKWALQVDNQHRGQTVATGALQDRLLQVGKCPIGGYSEQLT